MYHSTATVNSLHSSSHSSSSNQSSGEPLPPHLAYSLGSHSSIPDRDRDVLLLTREGSSRSSTSQQQTMPNSVTRGGGGGSIVSPSSGHTATLVVDTKENSFSQLCINNTNGQLIEPSQTHTKKYFHFSHTFSTLSLALTRSLSILCTLHYFFHCQLSLHNAQGNQPNLSCQLYPSSRPRHLKQ